jgi:hypothetical protein
MDDDGIAEVTATLRFDRAILLFWYLHKNIKPYRKIGFFCFYTIFIFKMIWENLKNYTILKKLIY